MKNALTREEWTALHMGREDWREDEDLRTLSARSWDWNFIVGEYGAHGAAAMLLLHGRTLDGESFGFTHEDVTRLRLLEYPDDDDSVGHDFSDLADCIQALLPPKEEE